MFLARGAPRDQQQGAQPRPDHVSSILTKMAVRDRTRAVLKAAELGLL